MRYVIILSCFLSLFNTQASAQGEIISMEKLATFTKAQQDSLQATVTSFVIPALYDVDYYKVLYLTPYLHPDSLVQASMGLAIPVNTECEVPIAVYGHGTQMDTHVSASRMNSGQWEVGLIFAGSGYSVALPDYLGIGFFDTARIPIHPYTHTFSQGNDMINAARATRNVLDSLGTTDNDQLFLFGYSQGGHATAAAVKILEAEFPGEFNIAGSAPMSGAYDTKNAQVDLMASFDPYPTPGYLPFILIAYQSIYGNLYTDIRDVMKSPYDTVIPALFANRVTGNGTISNACNPVPRLMIEDIYIDSFFNDPNFSLRVALADNDLVDGWAPQSPMRMFFCTGDDQVSYLNSVNAYTAWTAAGAPALDTVNFGNYDHNGCAPFAFLSAKGFFDGLKTSCPNNIRNTKSKLTTNVYPNPTAGLLMIDGLQATAVVQVYNIQGQLVKTVNTAGKSFEQIDLSEVAKGTYLVKVITEMGLSNHKVIVN
jgi:acetyl esterase/lipase